MKAQPTVLLLCGGASGEHEVSLASAASVLRAGSDVATWVPLVIDRDGCVLDEPTSLARLERARAGVPAPTHEPRSGGRIGRTLVHAFAVLDTNRFDLAFPLLHGPNGEDGTVQGALELLGLPYVGSGVMASAGAMDKITMKRIFGGAGLPQVAWHPLTGRTWRNDPDASLQAIETLAWPRFVKPANLGSSVGISRADDQDSLMVGIERAFEHDDRILVEAGESDARELEVAILGDDELIVSPAGEIRVEDGFYDYERKYHDDGVRLDVPATLDPDTLTRMQDLAVAAYRAIDASGLARVDLFLRPDGTLLVNEINTMPGFTRRSMYPRLIEEAGVPYPHLIERLLHLTLAGRAT